MSVAAAFLQAGFPVGFVLLFGFVAIVGVLTFFGVFVGAQRERRERQGGDRGYS